MTDHAKPSREDVRHERRLHEQDELRRSKQHAVIDKQRAEAERLREHLLKTSQKAKS